MNELREWLGRLAPRERNLVYLAAAVLGVAIIYFAIVLPVVTAAKNRTARIEQKTGDLAWMRQVAPQVMAASAAGRGPTGKYSRSVVIPAGRMSNAG